MCDPMTAILGGASIVSGILGGNKQAKEQKKAAKQAESAAKDNAAKAELDMARRNAKQPDAAGLLASNQQNGDASGDITTMLTGPGGVDPQSLALGKSTLLGM